jgi:NAD(P)-dependent dehydrogenase (short-subunit alcohol dehydrogenase family)
MKLNDRVAIVTGGGRGIGREIAFALAGEGTNVVVSGRQLDMLEQTATEIEAQGRGALAIVTDVSNEAQVAELVNQTLATFGRVDILVNNAGIAGPTASVTSLSREAWDEVMAVNLTGAFLCSRAVIPHMVERRSGKIVNISSVAGKMAYALRSPYAASKWGMLGFSASLAQELGGYNIQVNAICPGPTAGERMTSVIAGRAKELGRSADEVERLYLENTALKRMVDPKHVAAAVLFFCSEAGSSITGEALEVSAGYAL